MKLRYYLNVFIIFITKINDLIMKIMAKEHDTNDILQTFR